MKLILHIAWRNIWRNKRRTLITMASIVLAVFLAVLMRSMQLGTYGKMIDDVVGTYSGYVQVHKKGYWDDQTINNTFSVTPELLDSLQRPEGVKGVLPRIESFALASYGERTRGSIVVGTDPEKEDALTGLRKRIFKGSYLSSGSGGALVAAGLADFLRIGVGDTLVLLGQGYHCVTAAGAYPIVGLIDFASPELNRGFVYLDVTHAQEFFGTGARVTSAVIDIDDRKSTKPVISELRSVLDTSDSEVMAWHEMQKELVQQIQGDNAGGLIMLGILYMIVGFGIFGTIMMMTTERKREFGMVNALGLTQKKLMILVMLETLFLGLLSTIGGIVIALPLLIYMHGNPIELTGEAARGMINFGVEPILPFSLEPHIFISQALLVLLLTSIAALYPLMVIKKLEPVSAMHS